MITHFPNTDQYVAVSLTISPVTHVAETAVKRQSENGVTTRCCDEMGSMSKNVPSRISEKKLTIIEKGTSGSLLWKHEKDGTINPDLSKSLIPYGMKRPVGENELYLTWEGYRRQ